MKNKNLVAEINRKGFHSQLNSNENDSKLVTGKFLVSLNTNIATESGNSTSKFIFVAIFVLSDPKNLPVTSLE